MRIRKDHQQGFSIIQMVLAIGLMSFITLQLIPYVSAWHERQLIQATRNVVVHIAQAAVAFRAAQHDYFTTAVWPLDLQILVDKHHLPGPVTRYTNSFAEPITMAAAPFPGLWLEISTEMQTPRQARLLAGPWGAIASVNGEVVTLTIAVPGQESSHSEMVQLDGSHDGQQQVMRGPLHWDPSLLELDTGGNPIPTREAIDLGDNNIDQVRELNVRRLLRVEDSGAGRLEADIGNIQVLTATLFRADDFVYD